ncbi:unnamed protein product [Cuscuta campestris]|uniref:Retrotransposon Copia-like N-terminal domain-containing protein n=1 Tax=Cuscuta campestris TaxID=132261 RepID=A0A484M1V2_9ASTE|nr:unnamed protein product [Cuscuta campestris]
MATENSSSHIPIDIQSELYLHPTDSPNFSLASQKLNGENFPQWKRSAEIALRARNKLGFVDGSSKSPDVSSNPGFYTLLNLELRIVCYTVNLPRKYGRILMIALVKAMHQSYFSCTRK